MTTATRWATWFLPLLSSIGSHALLCCLELLGIHESREYFVNSKNTDSDFRRRRISEDLRHGRQQRSADLGLERAPGASGESSLVSSLPLASGFNQRWQECESVECWNQRYESSTRPYSKHQSSFLELWDPLAVGVWVVGFFNSSVGYPDRRLNLRNLRPHRRRVWDNVAS